MNVVLPWMVCTFLLILWSTKLIFKINEVLSMNDKLLTECRSVLEQNCELMEELRDLEKRYVSKLRSLPTDGIITYD